MRQSGNLPILLGALSVMLFGCGAPLDQPVAPAPPTSASGGSSGSVAPSASAETAPLPMEAAQRCSLPLSDYCTSCGRSYDATLLFPMPKRVHKRSGTCGVLRYIAWSDGFSSTTEYFNQQGVLVGAVTMEDFPRSCAGAPEDAVPFSFGDAPTDCP